MHYVVTGSLGHISKPIVEGLIKAGHSVTVITSRAENGSAIEALGAQPAVGSVEDATFLTDTFAGADAVYLMIPPKWGVNGWRAYQNKVGDNFIEALTANGIRYVVLLSSVGAHLGQGVGPVDGLYDMEHKLRAVPGLNAQLLRPSYFYYNLLNQVGLVKQAGILGSNFGGPQEKIVLTHTSDIADVAVEELLRLDFTGVQVRYIGSDERYSDEIAQVLGAAIGKPELQWVVFSDEQNKQGLLGAGLNDEMATEYTLLGESMRTGVMQADYWANRPTLGKVKLEDFAKNEFAPAFGA